MKTLFIPLFALMISAFAFAQKSKIEKIKSLKIAHITDQLELSKTEAQQFWPIYNAYETKKEALRKSSTNKRKLKNAETLTEDEAKHLVLEMLQVEENKHTLTANMVSELSEIISYKKIMALLHAERSFNRKVIARFKARHSRKERVYKNN